ncbi:uncharacterized protein DC041_0011936 [Schistosoma bovis]|uniref:Dendritic cell-specific transmembrane protein-like domain-containing protein n=1 Tax=Schistosoma bovis TaxID=6184 RepID=A0A430QFL9_SCHBO|nr:uncharacterized protein DC041_0011936 [Schistosoma bovis]CAH8441660.1 unnamed protein product [Schistosoma bovis]
MFSLKKINDKLCEHQLDSSDCDIISIENELDSKISPKRNVADSNWYRESRKNAKNPLISQYIPLSINSNNAVSNEKSDKNANRFTCEEEVKYAEKLKAVTTMNQKVVSSEIVNDREVRAQPTEEETWCGARRMNDASQSPSNTCQNRTHEKEYKGSGKDKQDYSLKNKHSESIKLDEQQIKAALYELQRPSYLLIPLYYLCQLCWNFCRRYPIRITLRHKQKRRPLQNIERICVKNTLGLIFGLSLGFITYFLFMITFSGNPHLSTLLSAYIMLISVYGLAFSENFQCITLLTFPYIIATRLRWAILIYATGMSFNGPGLNFLHNSGNFRNSIVCIIAQVNTNMMVLKKLTQSPFIVLKDQLENMIDGINNILNTLRNLLFKINFSIIQLTNVMESQASWIHSLIIACEDKISLMNQCLAFFNNIYFSCVNSFKILSSLCRFIRFFAKDTCVSSEKFTDLCRKQSAVLEETLNITTTTELTKQLHEIIHLIGSKNLTLYGNLSNIEVIFNDDHYISNKLQQRMDHFVQAIDVVKLILAWILVVWTLFTMLILVIQAIIFKKCWLSKDSYDNVYITDEFIKQEIQAFKRGLVPTVPLIRKEKKLYKKLSSFSWTISEKQSAVFNSLMLLTWSTSIILVMITDYVMYTIFNIMSVLFLYDYSDFGNITGKDDEQINEDETNELYIDGDSTFANIVQSLISLMNPLKNIELNIDVTLCRPTLTPPDLYKYAFICLLLSLAYFSVVFQVYIMRLRHVIMIWYYPKTAARRAAWLRIHIRNNRGLYNRIIHKIKTIDIASNHRSQNLSRFGRYLCRNPRVAYFLKLFGVQRIICTFCGSDGNPSKKVEFKQNFTRCEECDAYFCRPCQIALNHICLLCRTPMFSMSVEVDFEHYSTDEEKEYINARYLQINKHSSVISSDKLTDI